MNEQVGQSIGNVFPAFHQHRVVQQTQEECAEYQASQGSAAEGRVNRIGRLLDSQVRTAASAALNVGSSVW